MPVGQAPHRPVEHDPGPEERFELCRLAADGVEVADGVAGGGRSRRGLRTRPTPSSELGDADLFFLLGADQALRLAEWHEPERVLRAATLAIVEREEVPIEEAQAAVSAVGQARVEPFSMPRIDVSSTEVRRRVAEGRPYRFLVPEPVADRIERVGLYR